MWLRKKKKKLKSLVGFLSANKIDNYNREEKKVDKIIIDLKNLKLKLKKKMKNFTELQKPNIEAEVYNNNKKCDWIYIYTYTPKSKIKTVQQK